MLCRFPLATDADRNGKHDGRLARILAQICDTDDEHLDLAIGWTIECPPMEARAYR